MWSQRHRDLRDAAAFDCGVRKVRFLMTEETDCEIAARGCAACYVCGAIGQFFYSNLRDVTFGAGGEWSLKQCPNPECGGMAWLDPMPLEEDVYKAYQTYYTHQAATTLMP